MTYDDVYNKVHEMITEYLRLDEGELKPESHIVNDVGADSLALVELGFKFSEAFAIPMLNPTDENLIMKNLVSVIEGKCNKTGN
jgi:acyl carrier protein